MAYLSGSLYGDISIGNFFMTERPMKREPFLVPEEFIVHLPFLMAKIQVQCNRVA